MHELTEKIISGLKEEVYMTTLSSNITDKVITDWLKEKADELKSGSWDINRSHVVDKILGIAEESLEDKIRQRCIWLKEHKYGIDYSLVPEDMAKIAREHIKAHPEELT